jgi:hypothetical protein
MLKKIINEIKQQILELDDDAMRADKWFCQIVYQPVMVLHCQLVSCYELIAASNI